jgi:hypothetical protein
MFSFNEKVNFIDKFFTMWSDTKKSLKNIFFKKYFPTNKQDLSWNRKDKDNRYKGTYLSVPIILK